MSRPSPIVPAVSLALVLLTLALAALAFLLAATPRAARADDCRDSTGEPVPCVAANAPPPEPAAPAYAPPPPAVPGPARTPAVSPVVEPVIERPRTRDVGAVALFDVAGESLDLRPLGLTPSVPEDVADLARDTNVSGAGSAFDVPAMTFGFTFASRPLPWLEIPTLRVAWGFGTPEASVPVAGQAGRSADLGTLLLVRVELGAGVEVPIGDEVSMFARAHLGLAGYFVSARIVDEALGSLGRTWLAEDAWEGGWTLGLTLRLGPSVRWVTSFRHVHTGAESNALSLGFSVNLW